MDPLVQTFIVALLVGVAVAAMAVGAVVYASIAAVRRARRPFVQSPTPERTCETCKHFDLEEGQAMRRGHHAFNEVSRWVPPASMASAANDQIDYNDPLRIPQKASWDAFGACMKRKEHVWGPWSPEKRRLTILVGDDGGALPDCWTER